MRDRVKPWLREGRGRARGSGVPWRLAMASPATTFSSDSGFPLTKASPLQGLSPYKGL